MKSLAIVILFGIAAMHLTFGDPVIFLVRHAEKAHEGDTKNPNLSEAGRARAAALTAMLKDANITAIYATEFNRTQQTAKPLADAINVPVTVIPTKETEVLLAKLKNAQGNVLVVGHSNTLPEIINALGIKDPPEISETDFDRLFLLIPGAPPRVLQLHYR